MESREAEEQLGELESRIERLRALYEQFFLGIEKMEPQIPRKEVERRIWVLRREQIRNTGLRFRFQMLVQRYNSFQQYWGRVTREIENGTYRRDVMRAAARFGEKDALTLVGKRRREKYMRLAQAQKDAKDKRAASNRPAAHSDVEELDASVMESVPPTPLPPPKAAPEAPPLAPPEAPRAAVRAAPAPSDPEAARRRVAALAAQMKAPAARPAPAANGPLDLDLDLDTRRPPARRSTSPRGLEPVAARKSSSGRMRAVKIPPAPAVPADLRPSTGAVDKPPARRRSSSTMNAVRPAPVPPAAAAAEVPGPMARPVRAPVAVEPPVAARPPAAAAAAAASASPRTPTGGRPPVEDALQEQRLRQIYAKYIETKRLSNESTAGVTFEKLAESLRNQAAKLRAVHPSRRVDYEVIVKDGKTVLKPILR
jgi:hypothetical protein